MSYVVQNLRLEELIKVVNQNKDFHDELLEVLAANGFPSFQAFVMCSDPSRAEHVLNLLLAHDFAANLFDGIGRPYPKDKAAWYFLAWCLRDAPAQRLQPLIKGMGGSRPLDNKAKLLNQVRQHVGPLFPDATSWSWEALSEVMLARLEGSRRALKGGLFENLVRSTLKEIFHEKGSSLKVGNKEIRLNDETYDVQVIGQKGEILLPVKTRETMGGGHALLFTRDIHKSISVATSAGYSCVPIVIAESWSGNLDGLPSDQFIHIQTNPNQLDHVGSELKRELLEILDTLRQVE